MSPSKSWWLWSNREAREYLEETGQISVGRSELEGEGEWMDSVDVEEVTA